MDTKKLNLFSGFVSELECEALRKVVDEHTEWHVPNKRKMLSEIEHPIVKHILLEYLERVKKVYEEPELYITEYAPGMYARSQHMDVHDDTWARPYYHISGVAYLNDPSEYEGGEIYFPNLGVKFKPTKGDMALFPSGGEDYLHGVTEVSSGFRYQMPIWMTRDISHANAYIHDLA